MKSDTLRLRACGQDSRIIAVAIANGASVFARTVADFGQTPGLEIKDWTVLHADQTKLHIAST